jgi:hypothetical protein
VQTRDAVQITAAELMVARMVAWLVSGVLEGVPADIVDAFPMLREVRCLCYNTTPRTNY